ncbi:hypothetical protein NDU88_009072 [Pleurodeles waltl]|uniref:Uncharacterized protein n=1 Tax=Pleurodeles waltl TaxID=8319 RepID=A0AAV7P173_PLEWA|nr:hypothetical protein NDU88_009072 [Pleurodeles waltl]
MCRTWNRSSHVRPGPRPPPPNRLQGDTSTKCQLLYETLLIHRILFVKKKKLNGKDGCCYKVRENWKRKQEAEAGVVRRDDDERTSGLARPRRLSSLSPRRRLEHPGHPVLSACHWLSRPPSCGGPRALSTQTQ